MLPDALRAWGAEVDVLVVYDTVAATSLDVPVARLAGADFITFTSGSTARELFALASAAIAKEAAGAPRPVAELLAGVRLCSIGPATSAALRGLGLPVAVEAREHTAPGLVAAIAAAALAVG